MDLQQKLAENKIKREQNAKDLAGAHAETAKLKEEMAEIESQLAEAKKPKLRHGDYGTLSGGGLYFFNDSHNCNPPSERPFGIGQAGGGQVNADEYGPVILGNIFDDLKARQENVREFEIECDVDHEVLKVNLSPEDYSSAVIISIDNVDVRMEPDSFSEFALKVSQMEATIKREANKGR